MAATLTSTGITFSDGTSLASAAPAVGAVGNIISAFPRYTSPTASTAYTSATAAYTQSSTIAGSNLAYNIGNLPSGAAVTDSVNINYNYTVDGLTSLPFPSSGSRPNSNYNVTVGSYSATGGVITYSTFSGSWRALSGFGITFSQNGIYGRSAYWSPLLWIRYA